jgi:RNA polymerase sigma factor (sigma-70 family)
MGGTDTPPVLASNGESDTVDLVIGARRGDTASWDALVNRFASVVWSVTRSFGLPGADAAEVSQTVWLRLAEHIEDIRQPERVGAWLVTTTRRECTRHLRIQSRELCRENGDIEIRVAPAASADAPVLVDERDAVVHEAFGRLSERTRVLLAMLLSDPPMSYNDISTALGMPIGSIGPTRARALEVLRGHIERAGLASAD